MVQKAGVREDASPSEDELQRFGGVHAALDHQVSDEQCCRPGDTNNAMDEYTAYEKVNINSCRCRVESCRSETQTVSISTLVD